MSTDFTKPVVGDAYATLLPGIVTAINDLARGLEPTLTGTSTNVPTGAIRWNAGTSLWERYNGTSWAALAATYGISISGSAGSAATASNLTGGVAGAVPYQTGAGASAFSAAGTSGQVLSSNGTGAPTWIAQSALTAGNASAVAWSGVSGKPTTVGGYGITDGITTANIGSQSVNYAASAGAVAWSGVSSKPTTVAGYGIADMGSQSVNYANSAGTAGNGGVTSVNGSTGAVTVPTVKAWVNFNGGGTVGTYQTINASLNVTSVYKNANGDFTITFTTAMPNANYAFSGSVRDATYDIASVNSQVSAQTTTTLRIKVALWTGTSFIYANCVQNTIIVTA
jgi:hypothetical protein